MVGRSSRRLMRRYPERGDDPRIGRNKNVLSPEFGGRLVCVAGQPKDLDGVRVRIDDPVFGDAGAFVEREFFPAVPFFRPFGKNLQQKVRRAVDVLFSDEGQAIFRDEHQAPLISADKTLATLSPLQILW